MSGQAAEETPSGRDWSAERAEGHLRSLELFGMRFGLDRMRRMMTVLSSPERDFDTIHVLGTNGKSSTTRMIAAILERHGLATGAYLSPHLHSYTERIQIAEKDIEMGEFAAAVARAARAAERVNRTLSEDDHVTQFELLTAAAYWELARRKVTVGVIEAGLGGRYDATSVIDASVTVLTNVALEHTRWLGPTIGDIAREKLAATPADGTLAVGADLHPQALQAVDQTVRERHALLLTAPADGSPDSGLRGGFQRRNFALARVAGEAYLRRNGIQPDERAIAAAARETSVHGRLEVVGQDPPVIFDGAHNPDAVTALLSSLDEIPGGFHPARRPLGLVFGVLEDKDAASMLRPLLAVTKRAWYTAPKSSRALSPAALQSLAEQTGFTEGVCEPLPARALEQATLWARQQGPGAVILVTGSIYLVGALLNLLDRGDH